MVRGNADMAAIVARQRFASFGGFHQRIGGEGRQIVLPGASLPLSDALAAQLQDRIAAGSLAKSEFSVEDAEELEDVIGSLVAYGLLVRA